MRARRKLVVATVAAIASLTLGGCTAFDVVPGSAGVRAAGAAALAAQGAQEQVAALARQISDTRPDDIDGWARAAVEAAAPPEVSDPDDTGDSAPDILLIGIERQQSEKLDEPFGKLAFQVAVTSSMRDSAGVDDSGEPIPDRFCFRVAFDYYGKIGEWESTEGVDPFDCPADVVAVTPPPDTTIEQVVSPNSADAARAVLQERLDTADPSTADQITAAIAARLEPATGAYRVTAPPRVLVEAGAAGDRVGVVFGATRDCVLLKSENGAVTDLYVPRVLLQPGELGCTPETALTDPEHLRPPH